MKRIYEATGSVRGSCGHRHVSLRAACRCAASDQRACHRLGGGAYSDRTVVCVDGDLTDDECHEIDYILEM